MHLFCVTYRLCFVPRFNDDQMDMLRVHSVDDIDSLPAYKWGIKQPSCEGVYSLCTNDCEQEWHYYYFYS